MQTMPTSPGMATHDAAYAERLRRLQTARWKVWLGVQRPFGWNLRRLVRGATLDVGCGIGRSLVQLRGSHVGVDANPFCVAIARERGLEAYTPDEFFASAERARPGQFDTLLCSHVVEHMTEDEAASVLGQYVPSLRPGGRLVLICPQEAGFRSDATHITFMDADRLAGLATRLGCRPVSTQSFPFPRWVGAWFTYNETIVIADKP